MKENVKLSANGMIGINDLMLKGEIVVFGSTYMANFPLYEFINKYHFENAIYNRSIAGLTTSEALEIVQDCIISINPAKIFIALLFIILSSEFIILYHNSTRARALCTRSWQN